MILDIRIEHFAAGDLYTKSAHIPAGHVLVQHKHKYSHLSILASGSVEVMVDGVISHHIGPACLTIEAGKHHGVKALTDAVWYCIHSVAGAEADDDEDDALVIAPIPGEMERIAEEML